MPAQRASLPAVTAAGVVAMVFSILLALGSLLGGLSLLLMPDLPATSGAPALPSETRAMSAVMMFFMLALAVFAIFVSLGIFRRRNWARITILMWAGLMTLVCLGALAFSFVIFRVMQTQLPNGNGVDTEALMRFTRIFVFIFYGIPAGVGIWWLILFTRKNVSGAFTNSLPASMAVPAMDASGFPHYPDIARAQLAKRPTCPLPLAIIAGLSILGAACLLLFAFVRMPYNMPLFFFGHSFAGTSPRFVLLLFAVTSGVAGVGILKLKPWALYLELVFQFVGLLNCVATLFSPSYGPAMRATMQKVYAQNPLLIGNDLFLSDAYLRGSMFFATALVAAVLTVVLWQRSRFLEAAAVKKA